MSFFKFRQSYLGSNLLRSVLSESSAFFLSHPHCGGTMPLSKPLPVCKRFPADIDVGDYVQTAPLPTKIRCKAYTDPPSCVHGQIVFEGGYLCTLDPGTYIGPVEKIVYCEPYWTIRVRDYWINVSRNYTRFANKVESSEVECWKRYGWHTI